MPTIEITIFDASSFTLNHDDFKMAILVDQELLGHRGLFDETLQDRKGIMLHLGNPVFKNEEGCFWGSALIDWNSTNKNNIVLPIFDLENGKQASGANQKYVFQFHPNFREEINKLLNLALQQSPTKSIGFLTDYQFGPEEGLERKCTSIAEFWKIHEEEKLIFNTLYQLKT
ncbi:MAG: hypothetical protein ACPGXL_05830 [Chitinophagales bacterium]